MDQPSAPAAVPTRRISLEYHLHVARGRTREKYVLLRPVELSIIDAAPSD
ncbi:hypothetical protein Bequi_13330 [Brachybacterium sp. JHP9]|uniref:Uncharacterized protein n=1 Tax=Brachybacterium equifaecis TaxID=2910770 RepID=A0ABT0R353_9MICO|nr:hypothetical protein [Brachybacterium equifaecis]MCL6424347.1 hypothetical protein [Brachybacterium equifaecis]